MVNRREFIVHAFEAVLLTTAVGCSTSKIETTPPQTESLQEGSVFWDRSEYAKLPRLSNKELQEIFDFLENTKYPLLQKVGQDGKILTTSQPPPSEIPNWIDRSSFPLRVVEDTNSRASQLISYIVKYEETNEKKYIQVSGTERIIKPEVNRIFTAIQIGSSGIEEKDIALKAFLFAKEYLGFLTNITITEEIYPVLEKIAPYKITDIQGNPIIDPQKQQRVGRSIFYQNVSSATDIWNLADGFPMLLLAPAVIWLSLKKQLPENFNRIAGLAYAAKLANDEGVDYLKYLMETVNGWTSKNNLLLPKGTGTRVLQSPHADLIYELQRRLGNKK